MDTGKQEKQKTVQQWKQELRESTGEKREALIEEGRRDPRKGVQDCIRALEREEAALRSERLRLEEMKKYERRYYPACHAVCGLDEAGRGPLAGPVVAGACILPEDVEILYLNDSKKLTGRRREELFQEIQEKAVDWAVGIVSPERIDEINILQATFEAMRQALDQLKTAPDMLLVDAVTIPGVTVEQLGIVHGDGLSVSIAAASILAKVTRDRMMVEYDKAYPEYGFASHKGYGSEAHRNALKKYGPCPIHRRTFIKNFVE